MEIKNVLPSQVATEENSQYGKETQIKQQIW